MSWRDRLKVHPAADLFPMMSDAELDELARDIKKHGLRSPVVLFKGGSGGVLLDGADALLLDGRNRLAAAERAGLELLRPDGSLQWAHFKVVGADTEFDPVAYVVSANLHRRHLTGDQKRDLIAVLLKAKPERSDRATAAIAKVSDKTVGGVRDDLERRAEIPHVSTRTDTAGRQQPATKPPVTTKPAKPSSLSKEAQLRALREQGTRTVPEAAAPARYGIADELEQVLRVLRGDRSRIAQIPMAKRVALARGCLSLLAVTLDDLRPIGAAS